jgi:hypothetical protein
MHQIFEKLLGVCVQIYIDNIIIYSDSVEQYYEDLEKVFKVLKENNFIGQIDKYHFFLKQLKYLGKVVSKDGITTDPELISWIMNYLKPINVKQVRNFLSICFSKRGLLKIFKNCKTSY